MTDSFQQQKPHDNVVVFTNNYDPNKIIAEFKRLKCQVYMTRERMTLHFPVGINRFHMNELRLAFHKAKEGLWKILGKEFERQLQKKLTTEPVRVL